jgi:hypothetical protein
VIQTPPPFPGNPSDPNAAPLQTILEVSAGVESLDLSLSL